MQQYFREQIALIYSQFVPYFLLLAESGKIRPEFAELATRLAEDRMYRAVEETEYELTQYPKDMEKKKLYEDTAKSMK